MSKRGGGVRVIARLEVPYVPASLNRVLRWNPKRKKRERDMWARDLYIVAGLKTAKALRELSAIKAKMGVCVTIHNPRRYDRDNAWGAAKIPIDALRQIDFIHGDTEEFLDSDVQQEKATAKTRKTVIELWAA